MAKKGLKSMSDDHKAALAAGRAEGRAVRDYLEALEQSRPARGRRRTPESIQARLDAIDADIATADPVARLSLIQERRDLQAELDATTATVDIEALEKSFVKVAKSYSARKGIEYASWREIGVPAAVLKAAGIARGS